MPANYYLICNFLKLFKKFNFLSQGFKRIEFIRGLDGQLFVLNKYINIMEVNFQCRSDN
jgi:hypothetical protein